MMNSALRRGPLAPTPPSSPAPDALALRASALPPDLVAALLRPEGGESASAARGAGKVPRSFRAAILAGLIVAILNAAANATFAASASKGLGLFSFGSAHVPVVVGLLVAGLWSGARTSAICLLVAHRLLATLGLSSRLFYMLGGGAAALVLAVMLHALGDGLALGGLATETFSGMVAGLFYRVFAGTEREDA